MSNDIVLIFLLLCMAGLNKYSNHLKKSKESASQLGFWSVMLDTFFSGTLVFLVCAASGVNEYFTAIFVGMAGHEGYGNSKLVIIVKSILGAIK